MKNAVVSIHGKGGSADEALYYKKFFNDDYDVLGFDYKSELPWQAGEEFQNYFDSLIPNYNEILLIANSIGTYFSMLALSEKPIAWNIPTGILYGEKEDITSLETITNFANKIHADLTVFDEGEHWFHTEEQMNFLDTWFKRFV